MPPTLMFASFVQQSALAGQPPLIGWRQATAFPMTPAMLSCGEHISR